MTREGLFRVLLATMLAVGVFVVVVSPAEACSCAGIGDVGTAVAGAEGAFVGTLIDKRDAGNFEAIYIFEVEQWVKGDAGDVIEVRSASDGAGCGFEFFGDDQRTGALVRVEGGELHSSLCEQVDADVLLTVLDGPPLSTTGIGKLLTANGWNTTRLTVLDEAGALVTELDAGSPDDEWAGTQGLEVCPGGEVMLQSTGAAIYVWDLQTLTNTASHTVSGEDGYPFLADISCRDQSGTSILMVSQDEFTSSLVDLETGEVLLEELTGDAFFIGIDHLILQRSDPPETVALDIASGGETTIHRVPPGENWGVYVAANPSDSRIALSETRYPSGGGEPESTLLIITPEGETLERYDTPGETSTPVWLDDSHVLIQTYDWSNGEDTTAQLIDTSSGDIIPIEGWTASYPILVGTMLYGTRGGDVMTADIEEGTAEVLVTLPTQELGPLAPLSDPEPQEPPTVPEATPEPTVPALMAPDSGIGQPADGPLRTVAIAAVVLFAGLLIWLAVRRPAKQASEDGGERSDG